MACNSARRTHGIRLQESQVCDLTGFSTLVSAKLTRFLRVIEESSAAWTQDPGPNPDSKRFTGGTGNLQQMIERYFAAVKDLGG